MLRPIILFSIIIIPGLVKAQNLPDFSFEINKKGFHSRQIKNHTELDRILRIQSREDKVDSFIHHRMTFENISTDTIHLRNLVPFGTDPQQVYLTGKDEHGLSRTHLFIPGKIPVNVICPDNAWELGFSFLTNGNGKSNTGLTRREAGSIQKGQRRRFETILFPGGSVSYNMWTIALNGIWQDGLRLFFQQKKLFDLDHFDNRLFERKDLQWIRHSYIMHLMMAWDKNYYNLKDGKFHFMDFIQRGAKLYGGDDVIGLWPTWPSLGLDQRNQFDLFRDLPGGTKGLRKLSDNMRKSGTRLFLCYNPWDESTRKERHLQGLSTLIEETNADGIVLDTRGSSGKELQEAADNIKAGMVMYSEGMAIPKDMPGIISGRVHNALINFGNLTMASTSPSLFVPEYLNEKASVSASTSHLFPFFTG